MTILIKSIGVVKEVIRLDIHLLVIFTPYYDPSLPLWKLVRGNSYIVGTRGDGGRLRPNALACLMNFHIRPSL